MLLKPESITMVATDGHRLGTVAGGANQGVRRCRPSPPIVIDSGFSSISAPFRQRIARFFI